MLRPELQAYPAHLHIDILRDHQRLGGGHQLMSAFLGLLRSRDIPAVHLGVGESNVKARKFYQKAGFHPIGAPTDGTVYLGRSTAS
jgi:ribosomal protein S18 acetylase RimI-like enzyme